MSSRTARPRTPRGACALPLARAPERAVLPDPISRSPAARARRSRARACARAGVPVPRPASSSGRSQTLRSVGARAAALVGALSFPPRAYPIAAPLLWVQGIRWRLRRPGDRDRGLARGDQHGLALARESPALAPRGLGGDLGLARGIDAAPTPARWLAGGETIAVKACGPDLVYPAAHRRLASRLAAQGRGSTSFRPRRRRARSTSAAQSSDQRARGGAAGDRSARTQRHVVTADTRPRRASTCSRAGRWTAACAARTDCCATESTFALRPGGRLGCCAWEVSRLEPLREAASDQPRGREPVRWAPPSSRRSSALPRTATSSRGVSRARHRSWRSRSWSSSSPAGSARNAMEGSASYRRAKRVSYDRALRAEGACRSSASARSDRDTASARSS